MHLAQLRANNFRSFTQLSLQPHRRLNFIYGPNAAGKTTVLEAVYCLGRGRSFRGNSPNEISGPSDKGWGLLARAQRASGPARRIGVEAGASGTQLSLEDRPATVSELVRALPVQILEPGMHRLLQDGPGYRRSFVDWGVFHVEQGFHAAWRRYQRALRQRNQALRARSSARLVAAWDADLAAAGEEIQALRAAHIAALLPGFQVRARQMLDVPCSLELRPGWAGDSLARVLQQKLQRDQRMGLTVEGPHRAELLLCVDGLKARNRVSRGQQKLLIAALLLAQCELVGTRAGDHPILLVDDFPAELAPGFQAALLRQLTEYPGQVFITAFEPEGLLAHAGDAAVFHVERGRLHAA